eukprot:TRINITY_DN4364_c0_g1_i1.p1 TRINITY_DN4364_c0_g1~~TRINITY_DN4364_c0_g1_i1.p1  ORF type:complete len:346 (+),score=40.30 TRINITY_DN4364_c0_g1_i1:542-1579(+)
MNVKADSSVYGLDQPCRALDSVASPTQNLFLLGSLSLKGKNQIYLLEHKEDSAFLECLAMWSHPYEIWSLHSCPATSHRELFFTINGNAAKKKTATLWDKTNGLTQGLDKVISLSDGTAIVTWEPQGYEVTSVLAITNGNLETIKLDAEGAVSSSIPIPTEQRIQTCSWDPHHTHYAVVCAGSTMYKADLRQKEVETVVPDAHPTILCSEYNPNKQYTLATTGVDGTVKFWDLRKASSSLRVVEAHNHWANAVKYNPHHEQLLLTAGTDRESAVKLWNLPTLSSHQSSDDRNSNDSLLKSISDFDDSVYAIAWSSAWLFASVSYKGKVMVHQVPKDIKYSILLSE